jgi:hypothetical protein
MLAHIYSATSAGMCPLAEISQADFSLAGDSVLAVQRSLP